MVSKLMMAWTLMALCVAIHAGGVISALRWLRRQNSVGQEFWPATWLFIKLSGWIVFLHVLEIGVWAFFYSVSQAMPDLHSSFYFSAVTYTTTGYGDLTLPKDYRFVGGVEALTGVLMCGWSTGFFFAIVSRSFDMGQEKQGK
jgi:hypothetical protein